MRKFLLAAVACLMLPAASVLAGPANLVANVSIANQTMTVLEDGIVKYRWKVSTGGHGYITPVGSYDAQWASRNHRSRKYNNAPMPFAIFFKGGYAVHATFDTKRLGSPASHGCVRLHPDNAAQFYSLATSTGLGNTRIVISR
jgi:lipoprotein-anchoring transpeptidase ErfK/SrfK